MFVVISYDIADDRRRTRLAKFLEGFGDRVQYSVFEAELDESQLNDLIRDGRKIIDELEDSLRVYRLCAKCERLIEVMGCGKEYDVDFVFIV